MISNNIANVSTVGYKRTDAAFSSLVTSASRSSLYSPGSVRAEQRARVDQQGILQQTGSTTDVAISGNGFFVVKRVVDPAAEPLYTRAGSFSESAAGVLQNTAGFFLYGWPLDQDGNLPSSQADISSLVPVDVAFLGGLTQPTSTAQLALNLKSTQAQAAFPVTAGFSPDFSRGIRVYDSLGASQDVTLNFKKHVSPTATTTGTTDLSAIEGPLDGQLGITAGDAFDIDVGANTATVTITANMDLGGLLSTINALVDGNGDRYVFADLDSNGQLRFKARNIGDDITLAENTNTPLANLGLAGSVGLTAAPASPNLLATPDEVPNTEGWWHLEIVAPNGSVLTSGSINFDGSGQLNADPDTAGAVNIALNDIDWGNGSDPQDLNFNIASFTQFSGDYNVIFSRQNGAELGLRTGVTIDREGSVIALFSNGQTQALYQLPLATFANVNGLSEQTGNAFRESDESGNFNLREAGQGSAGLIENSTLEGSNVDLADEFSKMIVTQRAYSAGTKVITTADEMTAELLRLR